jgi:hypothetical protein
VDPIKPNAPQINPSPANPMKSKNNGLSRHPFIGGLKGSPRKARIPKVME